MKASKLLGFTLIGVALIIVLSVFYLNSNKSNQTLIFSPTQVLTVTWEKYKTVYLEQGTLRALDRQRGNITTSEGQSYTMLRSIWEGDKDTFDRTWQWTKDNLQHEEGDHLFAWLFGQHKDGQWGVLTEQGGEHTASDADQDITLALIFAYARWQDPAYLGDARVLLKDIWDKDVVTINGTPYMTSGDQEKVSGNPYVLINPSYLNPAWYRVFAKVDTDHPWKSLVVSSYDILERSSSDPLDKTSSVGLPPDWVAVNRTSGKVSVPQENSLTTNFGFDAIRTAWRIGLDAQWSGDERATTFLSKLSFLSDQWSANKKIASTYAHDGTIVVPDETASVYGALLGYFSFADKNAAQDIYENKLIYLYDPGANDWKQLLTYYDDNWAWFGIGLYNKLLPDLTADLPQSAWE
ncbi:hypothetical protein KW798_00470 [Candidatus Parcubacteria bacterium]|nr:hypothetical protein [Candidatus Parcubacteria bacterium]